MTCPAVERFFRQLLLKPTYASKAGIGPVLESSQTPVAIMRCASGTYEWEVAASVRHVLGRTAGGLAWGYFPLRDEAGELPEVLAVLAVPFAGAFAFSTGAAFAGDAAFALVVVFAAVFFGVEIPVPFRSA